MVFIVDPRTVTVSPNAVCKLSSRCSDDSWVEEEPATPLMRSTCCWPLTRSLRARPSRMRVELLPESSITLTGTSLPSAPTASRHITPNAILLTSTCAQQEDTFVVPLLSSWRS